MLLNVCTNLHIETNSNMLCPSHYLLFHVEQQRPLRFILLLSAYDIKMNLITLILRIREHFKPVIHNAGFAVLSRQIHHKEEIRLNSFYEHMNRKKFRLVQRFKITFG